MNGPRIAMVLHTSPATTASDVREFAQHVEQLGLDGVFVGDHLAPVTPTLESVVTLTAAAAATEHLQVGFGVLVAGLRNPAWLARQLASLQLLSGNRVILGVGAGGDVHGVAGWEAVGVPYHDRGKQTDRVLEQLPALISGQTVRLNAGVELTLGLPGVPPPVWIGGGSESALRRTVRFGDAWFPSMVLPDQVSRGLERLAELSAAAGRPTPALSVGGSVMLGPNASAETLEEFAGTLTRYYRVPAEQAHRLPMTGEPADVAERLARWAALGATYLVLGIVGDDWRRQCELVAEARAMLLPATFRHESQISRPTCP